MQVDKQPFPINTIDLEGKKMLIRPSIAESANKDNVVIGEPRKGKEGDKVLGREVVLDKQPDGKEVLKITIKIPYSGGNHKYKKILMLNLSNPRIQKLASGERVKLSASESSQLLICCYPNMQVKRPVIALLGHHIRSVQDLFRSKNFDAMQGHMGHGHRHHGCHNPPMHHIT